MATKGQAVSQIQWRLGNRTDLADRIDDEMDMTQATTLEDADFMPWFLLSEQQSYTTASGEERIALPTDFIREYEHGALWRYDSAASPQWKALTKDVDGSLRAALGVTLSATGKPTHYDLSGPYFRVFPVPDGAYSLRIKVYAHDVLPSTLATGDRNLWLRHGADWLISETALLMATHLQMASRQLRALETARDAAKRRVWVASEARKHANIRYVMGKELV